MSITVDQARLILRRSARNAGDTSSYSAYQVDLAIYGILTDFLRLTRCTLQTDSVNIYQDTSAVSFAGITSFFRQRVKSITLDSSSWATAVLAAGVVTSITVNRSLIYTSAPTVTFSGGSGTGAAATAVLTLGRVTSFTVTNGGSGYTSVPKVLLNGSEVNYTHGESARGIERTDYGAVQEYLCSSSSVPARLFFDSATTAIVVPSPKADGTLSVVWNPLLVSWTFGDATVSTALNVPDDHIVHVLQVGGAAQLQMTDPEHGYGSSAFAMYRDYRDSMKGADGDGSNVIVRSSRESIRRGWR